MNLENNLINSFIIRTCEQRPERIKIYNKYIPGLIEIFDTENNPMLNMKKALQYQINCNISSVQMEDDIELCNDFVKKCAIEIKKRPMELIQFFSMRKDDLVIGSRYIAGYNYLMNQCFYLPLYIAKFALDCFDEFEEKRTDNRIGGTDSLIQFTLKKYKLKYWNVVPNLVDHISGFSAIDKRRSSKRQSLTFKYE
jgi:hypothetical protein